MTQITKCQVTCEPMVNEINFNISVTLYVNDFDIDYEGLYTFSGKQLPLLAFQWQYNSNHDFVV